uniref:Uncharacterized protein n=1 Tax=Panagrolaimus sp. PS1159 TaxID=55785 RepID=A0AC35GWY3_9BILA
MTTINAYLLPFKDKHGTFTTYTSNENQYNNLNLNQNHKFSANSFFKTSKNVTIEKRKVLNNAYENSIKANLFDEKKDCKKLLNKQRKNLKQIYIESVIQNPFEFSRQQQENDDEEKVPEISEFKASQHLIDPNQMNQHLSDSNEHISISESESETQLDDDKMCILERIKEVYLKAMEAEIEMSKESPETKEEFANTLSRIVAERAKIDPNVAYDTFKEEVLDLFNSEDQVSFIL